MNWVTHCEFILIRKKTYLWTTPITAYSSSANNIVIDDNGQLICSFIADGEGNFKLHKIDPANGTITWSSTDQSTFGGMLLSSGNVTQYFPLNFGLHLMDLQNEEIQHFTEDILPSPVAFNNADQLVIAHNVSFTTQLSTFDQDQTKTWTQEVLGIRPYPIFISDNSVYYIMINDGSPEPLKIIAIQGNAPLASDGWPRLAHDNRNTSNNSKH